MDPPYMPQRAHSHRQYSPTWATTQEFLVFIHHPEPQLKRCHSEPQLKECHVLNPYPKPQCKGYVLSHNSRNTSLVDHAHPKHAKHKSGPCIIAWSCYRAARRNPFPDCLAGATFRQAPSALKHPDLQTLPGMTTFTIRRYAL